MTLTTSIARFLCPGSGQHFDPAWPCPTCQDTAERLFLFISCGCHAPHDPEEHPTTPEPANLTVWREMTGCICINRYSDPNCPYHETPHEDITYAIIDAGWGAARRLAREPG